MIQSRGYCVPDSVGDLVGSLAGRGAVIVGNAQGALDEYDKALRILGDPAVFAVNDAGIYLGAFDGWISLHGDKFKEWKERRAGALSAKTHSIFSPGADYDWTGLEPAHFSLSGLFAMQIAWILGAERIVLCGCPGDPKPRIDGSRNDTPGFGYGSGTTGSDGAIRRELGREMIRLPQFKNAVRSMSGATNTYFGGL